MKFLNIKSCSNNYMTFYHIKSHNQVLKFRINDEIIKTIT